MEKFFGRDAVRLAGWIMQMKGKKTGIRAGRRSQPRMAGAELIPWIAASLRNSPAVKWKHLLNDSWLLLAVQEEHLEHLPSLTAMLTKGQEREIGYIISTNIFKFMCRV